MYPQLAKNHLEEILVDNMIRANFKDLHYLVEVEKNNFDLVLPQTV